MRVETVCFLDWVDLYKISKHYFTLDEPYEGTWWIVDLKIWMSDFQTTNEIPIDDFDRSLPECLRQADEALILIYSALCDGYLPIVDSYYVDE